MKIFGYTAIKVNGEKISGEIIAKNKGEIFLKLLGEGYAFIDVCEIDKEVNQHMEMTPRSRVDEYAKCISERYLEKNRYYHNIDHVMKMLEEVRKINLTNIDLYVLEMAIVFHDVIYDPRELILGRNELRSAEFFMKQYPNLPQRQRIYDLILSTDLFSDPPESVVADPLFDKLRRLDTKDLIECNYIELTKSSRKIEKEFQFYDWNNLKEGRAEFARRLKDRFPITYGKACDFLVEEIESHVPNIGVYAGTFDPFHIGHLSILRQAEKIFDKVIVLVADNSKKDSGAMGSTLNSRHSKIKHLLKYHQVERLAHGDLLTDWLRGLSYPVTLIRGLRTDTDFKHEEMQLRVNQDLWPELKTVFILCEKDKEHVSSSMIRDLRNLGSINGQASKHVQKYELTTSQIYGTVD